MVDGFGEHLHRLVNQCVRRTVTFAGTANLLPSSATGTFVVTREETALTYIGDTTSPNGGIAHMSADRSRASRSRRPQRRDCPRQHRPILSTNFESRTLAELIPAAFVQINSLDEVPVSP